MIKITSISNGDRSVELPSLNVEHNYPHLLSELVMKLWNIVKIAFRTINHLRTWCDYFCNSSNNEKRSFVIQITLMGLYTYFWCRLQSLIDIKNYCSYFVHPVRNKKINSYSTFCIKYFVDPKCDSRYMSCLTFYWWQSTSKLDLYDFLLYT